MYQLVYEFDMCITHASHTIFNMITMSIITSLVLLFVYVNQALSLVIREEYSFRYLTSVSCTNSLKSTPYFCYHNEQIDNATIATITRRLIMTSSERCVNNTVENISVGVAVVNRVNVVKNKKINETCTSIMLFVSCDNLYMYTSIGPNKSVVLDPRCYHVFNITTEDINDEDDCVSRIVEPRIADYRQILDGTHTCYKTESNFSWTIISIDLCLLIIILILIVLRCIPLLVSE